MLCALDIQDFVIVDRVRMEFSTGFCVLSGETGAGKSILVDALLAVLGGRADSGVVRHGRPRTEVSAEFDAAAVPALAAWLEEQGLSGEAGECILRRVIEAGGRSRAFINGRPATAAQLREAGEFLVDIFGQHEHQSLMRAATQRRLLDDWSGAAALAAEVAGLHRRWREAAQSREAAAGRAEALAEERDRLAWQLDELDRLGFSSGEWDELQSEQARLANAQALIEAAEAGMEALSDGDAALLPGIAAVTSRLRAQSGHDAALHPAVEALEGAEIQLKEAAHALRQYRQRLDLDPDRLREVDARLDAVLALARKHRVAPDALPGHGERLRARLAEIGDSLDVEGLARAEAQTRGAFMEAAVRLGAQRARGAEALSREVTAAMQGLAMEGGRFEVSLAALDEPAATGLEQVEFQVAPHPGSPARPVAKVASGGELSRLSLALQTVTSRVAGVPTLVFDEVDAGIGGGVAEIVGRMLAQLGHGRQVLCITHLPQVAACATRQWRVSKRSESGETLSAVEPLEGDDRVEEIARMLGGVTITGTTRRHAKELLGMARAAEGPRSLH
jgi:DNA repair protein RecN (Recombination protein N)